MYLFILKLSMGKESGEHWCDGNLDVT